MAGCLKQGWASRWLAWRIESDAGRSPTGTLADFCSHPMIIRIPESLKFVNSKNFHSNPKSYVPSYQ
jgi:hypothetical protein